MEQKKKLGVNELNDDQMESVQGGINFDPFGRISKNGADYIVKVTINEILSIKGGELDLQTNTYKFKSEDAAIQFCKDNNLDLNRRFLPPMLGGK